MPLPKLYSNIPIPLYIRVIKTQATKGWQMFYIDSA
jgi:hypothetical protein